MLFLTAETFHQPFSNDTSNIVDKRQTDNMAHRIFSTISTNFVGKAPTDNKENRSSTNPTREGPRKLFISTAY
jgi:hypothetical protein